MGAGTGTATDTPAAEQSGVEIVESPPKKETPKKAQAPTGSAGAPAVAALPGTTIRFEGGNGMTPDTAILILGAKGEIDGVGSEYQFLSIVHGQKGTAWKLQQQALMNHNGHQMDRMDVVLADGKKLVYYFDISDFFGKF